jgi:spermidine synthase
VGKSFLFKKFISYFYPLKINVLESKVSGEIELSLQNGQWVVDTKVANYSYGSLHHSFSKSGERFPVCP